MTESYWGRLATYSAAKRRLGAFQDSAFFPSYPFSSGTAGPQQAGNEAVQGFSTQQSDFFRENQSRVVRLNWPGHPVRLWESCPGDADRPGHLFSLTKSLFSLLWASVRLDGQLPSDQTSLRDLGLEMSDRQAERLTLDQLWRMDSGLGFREDFRWGSDQILTFLHPDARKTALRARMKDPPSQDFHYNDYHTLLLGLVLERHLEARGLGGQNGEPTLVRAWRERLWVPMELGSGTWILDSHRRGFPKTESGLVLTAQAVEALGRLVVQKGVWREKQLFDFDWLESGLNRAGSWNRPEDFRRYTSSAWGSWLAQGRGWYGRHWWGLERRGETAWFALGIHGQVLLIRPQIGATAVRLGDRWAWKGWWPELLFDLLDEKALVD